MIRATRIKGAPFWGPLGCALLLLAACTDDKNFMPQADPETARVAIAAEDVGLITETKNDEPCYELRTDVVKGEETSMGQYGCLQPSDMLSADFLVFPDHEAPTVSGTVTPVLKVIDRLAVGGAISPSVATVTVNGGPTYRDGPYFLAVLPTIPDGDVHIVGTDQSGKVVVDQRHPRALVTAQKTPASTRAPDPATRP